MSVKKKNYCVILASGAGTRFGLQKPKQFCRVNGKMIIEYTLQSCDVGLFDGIIVVVSKPYLHKISNLVKGKYSAPIHVVEGGRSRMESCRLGVAAICEDNANVVIHNGVQPFVKRSDFEKCLVALEKYDAVTVASSCVYTILELNDRREIERVVRREHSVNDLGPECFDKQLLEKIFCVSVGDATLTNLTGVLLKHGLSKVYVVNGDPTNVKITYRDDMYVVRRMLKNLKKEPQDV